ncbi:unnamed protein product [Callosobruchus maculatus]|uniref:Protein regulator of cytokinesis 1 n=1 Tax=Callosobruchus maculatus TaxID=64391 RepID=A0A653DUC3_CALMS|nr:unnamed protein product [Callosobruchus maculatus]
MASQYSQFTPSKKLQQLPTVNEDNIRGHKMFEECYQSIQEHLKKGFLNWAQIVIELTDDKEEISSYLNVFQESLDETIVDLIKEMNEMQDRCISRVEATLIKMEHICKSLQLPMPSCGKNKLCLRQEYQQLKKQIEEYQQIYDARFAEIDNLREKQQNICKSLGVEPKILKQDPLPSAADLEQFKEYLDQLEDERFKRQEKFCSTREDILKIIGQLNYKPCLEFEKQVISGNDFQVCNENMERLEQFHQQLQRDFKNVKEEIIDSWMKLQELWNMLDIELLEQHKFRETHKGNSLDVLEGLREELVRCNDLKKANIEKFVITLREQIKEMWQKCHVSEEEADFKFFNTNHYSETILELFELELEKWKTYYEENKEIIQLLNKHQKLWSKMLELQENANAGRLKNRGGQLLKEEKERNKLSKSIPKIEAQLQLLCGKFEERHQRPFTSFGQTVAEYLDNLHEDWENMRKAKVSARKTPNAAATTAAMITLGSRATPMRSVTNLNFGGGPGPSGGQPKATPKRKLLPPSASSVQLSLKKPKVSPSALRKQKHVVPKITVSVGKRNSKELKKIEKRRRSSVILKRTIHEIGDDDEYVDFIMRPVAFSSVCEPIPEERD